MKVNKVEYRGEKGKLALGITLDRARIFKPFGSRNSVGMFLMNKKMQR